MKLFLLLIGVRSLLVCGYINNNILNIIFYLLKKMCLFLLIKHLLNHTI